LLVDSICPPTAFLGVFALSILLSLSFEFERAERREEIVVFLPQFATEFASPKEDEVEVVEDIGKEKSIEDEEEEEEEEEEDRMEEEGDNGEGKGET